MNYISQIKNAGSVFLGFWSPEAMGDYITGSNHVLPTNGTSKFSSSLSVFDFMKAVKFVFSFEFVLWVLSLIHI